MSNEHIEEGMSVQPKLYELGYLLAPLIASGSVEEEVSRVKAILGTDIKAEGKLVMQHLAYPISKNIGSNSHDFDDAYFGWIKFEATPEQMSTIKHELEKLEIIIRYLLTKSELTEADLNPSPEIKEEAEKDEVKDEVQEVDDSEVPVVSPDQPEGDRDAAIDKEIDDLLEREQL
ncbi:MAG: 30S ribosomal protein S6 [bacterium]|nr:30S ribosomal protein S6 [bacterium]